ncbi:membrane protein of ER body-like protein [Camellia sinensis]|uniref:membrane protein of ER body-like protein n=1 Tax=Camellia sinensis TaxID=4442 RepID=UPI0010365A10|nr:membrane protein of ER body-like protein [Camellia sinensis]
MEAMAVKTREAVEEVGLQWLQRRPRHQNDTITAANGNGSSTVEDGEEEINGSVLLEKMEEIGGTEPTEIRSSETYYTTVDSSLSKANGSTREEELDVKLKKIDIQKILRSVITHQDEETVKHETSCEEEYMLFKLLSEGTKELVNINRFDHKESNEEIEFEFERVVEKLDQHSVHCPKCNSCITKVVLRKKVRTSTVPPKPFGLLKCFSCFSIFIPKGIFRRPNGVANEQSLHKTSSALDENLSSIFTDDRKGKMVKIDQQQGRFFDIFRASTSKQNPQPTSAITGNYPTCVTYETASVVIGQEETKAPRGQNYYPPSPSQESVSPGKAVSKTEVVNNVINGPERAPSTNGVVPPGGLGHLAINIKDGSDDKLSIKSEGHQTGDREIIDDEKSEGTIERGASIITLDEEGSKTLEILKSVVYGGLMESMTSLSVVSSAAAADATTMNIVAMGLANLIGGLFIIGPNLRELKNEESGQVDRYKELLGQRKNFLLHATVAVLAFLIFGLIPPVAYGFSFRQIDDKDLKLVVVAAASLLCIAILAIGKAYIQKKPNFYTYIKTVLYYISMAVMASGISYAAGELIKRLVEELAWFDSSVAVTLSLPQVQSVNPVWGSY